MVLGWLLSPSMVEWLIEIQLSNQYDIEKRSLYYMAKSKTQSRFVRHELMSNVRGYSNGESAFLYFTEKIGEAGLYILDEPENSLSPKRQIPIMDSKLSKVRRKKAQALNESLSVRRYEGYNPN